MAPTLKDNWQERLRELPENWDGERGVPITAKAIATVEQFATVPIGFGGVQLEIHRDGYDIEIQIGSNGRILSVLCAHDNC